MDFKLSKEQEIKRAARGFADQNTSISVATSARRQDCSPYGRVKPNFALSRSQFGGY